MGKGQCVERKDFSVKGGERTASMMRTWAVKSGEERAEQSEARAARYRSSLTSSQGIGSSSPHALATYSTLSCVGETSRETLRETRRPSASESLGCPFVLAYARARVS